MTRVSELINAAGEAGVKVLCLQVSGGAPANQSTAMHRLVISLAACTRR